MVSRHVDGSHAADLLTFFEQENMTSDRCRGVESMGGIRIRISKVCRYQRGYWVVVFFLCRFFLRPLRAFHGR